MSVSAVAVASTVVCLNVGGTLFYCNAQTLASSPPGLLQRMFASNEWTAAAVTCRDAAGNIFLCRDAAPFPAILSYIRTGKIHVPIGVDAETVHDEFLYFFDAMPEDAGTDAVVAATNDLRVKERSSMHFLKANDKVFVDPKKAFGRWLQVNKDKYHELGPLLPYSGDLPWYFIPRKICNKAFSDFTSQVLAYVPYLCSSNGDQSKPDK